MLSIALTFRTRSFPLALLLFLTFTAKVFANVVSTIPTSHSVVPHSTNGLVHIPLQSPLQVLSKAPSHPAIVHQKHTNRGWSRLALMTNRPRPSKKELLGRFHHRLSFLPQHVKAAYSFAQITEWLNLASSGSTMQPSVTTHLYIQANDIGYIASIQMGTPARDFRVLVDSGSADFWVGEDGCQDDDGGDCGHHNFIGKNSSTTFVAPDPDDMYDSMWFIGYVSGLVSGYTAEDTVSFGGLLMPKLQFGAALNESSDFTSDQVPFDGIMGFANSSISRQPIPTFLDALHSRGLVSSRIASFLLPRLRDGKDDGEMTLGGLNPLVYEPSTLIQTPNVNKFGFWEASVDNVLIGDIPLDAANRSLVFDTGTTLMIIPEKDAQAIHAAIPGAVHTGGGWTLPCDTNTTIVITIRGRPFSIDSRDLTFAPLDESDPHGMCISGIGVGGVGPFYLEHVWLAGAVFLKNAYFSTNEEDNQITLARLRD